MPQSFCQLYAHLIFSTKNRQRFLNPSIRGRVHAYMAGIVRDLCTPYVIVGGPDDHVHSLFDIGKNHPPVKLVEIVKKETSKFVKTLGDEYRDFYWQRGYGMFSVGPIHRDEVKAYIETQEEHYKRMTFQEEFRAYLQKYNIPFDERYVWD